MGFIASTSNEKFDGEKNKELKKTFARNGRKTMKTQKIIQSILTLAAVFSLYTSCSPASKALSSYDSIKSEESTNANIVGGKESDLQFQQDHGIVAVIIVLENIFGQTGQSLCTGTLIDKKIILTAAHCVQDTGRTHVKSVYVAFTNNLSGLKKENVLKADAYLAHEDFLKDVNFDNPIDKTIWNDIALIRLETEAPSTFKFSALPLNSDIINEIKAAKAKKLSFSGFGIATPIVNKEVKDPVTGEVQVVPVPEEKNTSGVLRAIDGIKILSITDDNKEILLKQSIKKGACHGDSGGPAYFKQKDGQLVQVGVTSRGTNHLGNCDENVIYTGVVGQLDWIKTTSAKLLAK